MILTDQRYRYGKAVTPSDSTENLRNARALHNKGTAGKCTLRQNAAGGHVAGGDATIEVYLAQGATFVLPEAVMGVNSTSLGAGMELIALY